MRQGWEGEAYKLSLAAANSCFATKAIKSHLTNMTSIETYILIWIVYLISSFDVSPFKDPSLFCYIEGHRPKSVEPSQAKPALSRNSILLLYSKEQYDNRDNLIRHCHGLVESRSLTDCMASLFVTYDPCSHTLRVQWLLLCILLFNLSICL